MKLALPCAALLACTLPAAAAQPAVLRDPMQPPTRSAGSAPAPAGGVPSPAPPPPRVRHLLTSGTQRWVVEDSRRYGVGDAMAGGRIERIEDSAVVLRQGQREWRLPMYARVVKQPAAGNADPAAPAARQTSEPLPTDALSERARECTAVARKPDEIACSTP